MNIIPISINQPNNLNFKAKCNDYMTKMVIEPNKNKITDLKKLETSAITTAATAVSALSIDEILKSKGVYFCKTDDNLINVSGGYNGGFYKIKTRAISSEPAAKDYIFRAINGSDALAGGLANYMDMVKDIKRQDIIKKGLKIHTYELDNNVPDKNKKTAAYILSKQLKYNIRPTDLFFVNGEAFCYNKYGKIAYGLNLNAMKTNTNPVIRVCKFKTDKRGNAIGFNTKDWDTYQWQVREIEYSEQTQPSTNLPRIANSENNRLFAEAFRFGNSTIQDNYRLKISTPTVLEHLSKKVGIVGADINDLQFIRYYDENNKIQSRIGFFDTATGRSLIYDRNGQYMYQMQYNRDNNGNITACCRF